MPPRSPFTQVIASLSADISRLTLDEIINRHIDRDDSSKTAIGIKLNEVKNILSANNKAKIIFGSHIGWGKTTELRCLEHYLTEEEKFLVVYVSSKSDLRRELWKEQKQIYFADLLYLLITKTIEKMNDNLLNQEQINELQKILQDTFGELITFDTKSGQTPDANILRSSLNTAWNKLKNDLPGIFRQKADISTPDLISGINKITRECIRQNHIAGLLIIVDDLHRISDDICGFLDTHKFNIQNLECSLVITVPASFFFNSELQRYKDELTQIYDKVYFLPPFHTHDEHWGDNSDQIKLMVDIIKKKIGPDSNLLPDEVLLRAARLSGGLIPDLLMMIKNCCNKVMNESPSKVNVEMLIRF